MNGHEAIRRNNERARERCDRALVEFQRGHVRGFSSLRLQPFEGEKLSIEQLCAECGLVYRDGLVHAPPKPIEALRRVA